jgi:zinc transport system permease protein
LFTASLAVGILMLPNADVVESLFGSFPALATPLLIAILVAAMILSALCFWLAKRFLFLIVSPDLAKVHGVGRAYDLALLLIFAAIVALGIKLVGTLLMGALTIIPASIAKNLAPSMRRYIILSAVLGGVISVSGVWLAQTFRFLPGPAIVLLGVAAFALTLPVAGRAG